MNRKIRALLLALAGVTSLATAQAAFAAYAPKLVVTTASQALGAAGGVKIRFQAPATDDPTARAVIYVPRDFQVNLTAGPGTRLGTVTATAAAADLGGAVLPLTGTVDVANPAEFAVQATQCTGTTTHGAYWVLVLTAAGQTLRVPIFVDAIAAPNPLSAIASAQLVICLPPPDVPAGTPGRAAFGAKVLTAEFTVSSITNPAVAGDHRWRVVATPYRPGVGTANPAGTVEAQSIVRLPLALTLRARVSSNTPTATTFSVTGTFGPRPTSGWAVAGHAPTIELLRGATATALRRFAAPTPDQTGKFSAVVAVRRGKTATRLFLAARATNAEEELGAAGCVATFVPPLSPVAIPCISATIGAIALRSVTIRVTVPAAPKKKKK